jgi:predicted RNA-binding Zn-ribbon protein involved in translation (DUF1610 family)
MKYGIIICPDCGDRHFSWQSCGNRNCPKCGNEKITRWLTERQKEILPVDYFMVTFALPAELRGVCRREPVKVYNAFFKAAAESLKELSMDKRFVGGKPWERSTWRVRRSPASSLPVPGGGLGKILALSEESRFSGRGAVGETLRNKFRIELKTGIEG